MTDPQKRLLKAKIAVALLDELGRRPTPQEVDRFTLASCVLYKTVLGVHYERKTQQREGQLALF